LTPLTNWGKILFMELETFSKTAADWIRLRRALYGPEEAKALMMRCYRRSKSGRINERTVLAAWQELDDALNAVIQDDSSPSDRAAYLDAFRFQGEQ